MIDVDSSDDYDLNTHACAHGVSMDKEFETDEEYEDSGFFQLELCK